MRFSSAASELASTGPFFYHPALLCRRSDQRRSSILVRLRFMPRLFHKLIAFAVGGTLLVLAAGCQAPLAAHGDAQKLEASHRHAQPQEPPKQKAMQSVATAADEATVATVMQEVQRSARRIRPLGDCCSTS